LVQIELDRIYIRLRATRLRVVEAEERWLAQEAALAPGEIRRPRQQHSPTIPGAMFLWDFSSRGEQ